MQCCGIAWELNSDSVSQKRPHTNNRRLSGRMSTKSVLGFPLDANQFSTLDEHQSAETQCQREEEVGLVDPRTTRHLRTAAIRAEEEEAKQMQAAPLYHHMELHREICILELVLTLLQLKIVLKHYLFKILFLPIPQTFCHSSLVEVYRICWEMV